MRASWRKEMLLLMIIMVFVAVDVADDGDVVCENVDGVAVRNTDVLFHINIIFKLFSRIS